MLAATREVEKLYGASNSEDGDVPTAAVRIMEKMRDEQGQTATGEWEYVVALQDSNEDELRQLITKFLKARAS